MSEHNVSYSSRLMHAILDHLLALLPEEPAAAKRLSDITDPDDGIAPSELPPEATRPRELLVPASGIHSKPDAPAQKKHVVS